MATHHEVTGPLAVVEVAGTSRYLYRGARLPEGVTNLRHLISVGLVSEVTVHVVTTPTEEELLQAQLAKAEQEEAQTKARVEQERAEQEAREQQEAQAKAEQEAVAKAQAEQQQTAQPAKQPTRKQSGQS